MICAVAFIDLLPAGSYWAVSGLSSIEEMMSLSVGIRPLSGQADSEERALSTMRTLKTQRHRLLVAPAPEAPTLR